MQNLKEVLVDVGEAMRATKDLDSKRYYYLFGVQQALLHVEYGEMASSPLAIIESCSDLKE